MKIRFKKYDKLVPLSKLKSHPKNRNVHPDEQIKRLAEIMKYQGVRMPITVSKRSGFITRGHGRLAAAALNGWKQFPVVYQDYDSAEQEYADLQADNAIASWAELDISAIRVDVAEMKLDFSLIGLPEIPMRENKEKESSPKNSNFVKCPACGVFLGS